MEEKSSEKFGNVDEKNQGYRNRYNLIVNPVPAEINQTKIFDFDI